VTGVTGVSGTRAFPSVGTTARPPPPAAETRQRRDMTLKDKTAVVGVGATPYY
jgi:hypothetical protein